MKYLGHSKYVSTGITIYCVLQAQNFHQYQGKTNYQQKVNMSSFRWSAFFSNIFKLNYVHCL